jgi:hypothetical protein
MELSKKMTNISNWYVIFIPWFFPLVINIYFLLNLFFLAINIEHNITIQSVLKDSESLYMYFLHIQYMKSRIELMHVIHTCYNWKLIMMKAADKVWITELTLLHKNIRSVRNSHVQELTLILKIICQFDVKHGSTT